MVTATVQETKVFEKPIIDAGYYPAEVVEVKEISPGEHGQKIICICKVQAETDVQLGHVCYTKITEGTKAGRMIKCFIPNFEFKPGVDFNFDLLVGARALALVDDYEYEVEGKKVKASSIERFKPLVEEVNDKGK